jgi:hypothetical protein
MFDLMKMAHEKDITLNQMVEEVLRRVIDEKTIRNDFDKLFAID